MSPWLSGVLRENSISGGLGLPRQLYKSCYWSGCTAACASVIILLQRADELGVRSLVLEITFPSRIRKSRVTGMCPSNADCLEQYRRHRWCVAYLQFMLGGVIKNRVVGIRHAFCRKRNGSANSAGELHAERRQQVFEPQSALFRRSDVHPYRQRRPSKSIA